MHFIWLLLGILQALLMLVKICGVKGKERQKIMNWSFYALLFGGIISGVLTFIFSYIISDSFYLTGIFLSTDVLIQILGCCLFKKHCKRKKQNKGTDKNGK